ncbi:phosphoribosylformylglycinamidine cyclo-ligase [Bacillus fonticola]|uniref:phosphoribosylformylglycinamidine cyclo-ligase n=1 Tax=Bacillus fonticola TaxID=2728853 RepID=UPI0014764937|nr:phosphoribosylformylglycinamidine cyclo-ligase [Bacillus fonticola]
MSRAYTEAGVNLENGYESVRRITPHLEKTKRLGSLPFQGGFGAMFDLSALNLKEPVLVSGTDGVGTKLKVAFTMNEHGGIGQDVVAMCVNDIVAQGAEPLYFLDYLATGHLQPEQAEAIVGGIAAACEQVGAALIGGETAEMPGMYAAGEYDVAGFAVGACEKPDIITGTEVKSGDVVIGLSSTGVHSNGFSLIRHWMDTYTIPYDRYVDVLGETVGEALLRPTALYAKALQAVRQKVTVKGCAHITGGGFLENIPRTLPEGLGVELDLSSWTVPAVFSYFHEVTGVSYEEMRDVFNVGIGMVVIVRPEDAPETLQTLQNAGEKASMMGTVVQREGVSYIGEHNVLFGTRA